MASNMSNKMTWPEREFVKLMKEIGCKYEAQKIILGKIYDFYIPCINTLIEIDGDYYHGNPLIFESLNSMQKRNQKNDKKKDVIAIGCGYKLERIYENDLKNNYSKIKQKFISLLVF